MKPTVNDRKNLVNDDYSFIQEFIRRVERNLLRGAPAQPRRYRSVLSNLQNALSLFLSRRRISKKSPFQVEGPTMEKARRCLIAVLARGANSWPVAEERIARRPGRPATGLQSSHEPNHLSPTPLRVNVINGWPIAFFLFVFLCPSTTSPAFFSHLKTALFDRAGVGSASE